MLNIKSHFVLGLASSFHVEVFNTRDVRGNRESFHSIIHLYTHRIIHHH